MVTVPDVAWSRVEQVAEFRQRELAFLSGGGIHGRELVAPMEGPASIDHSPAVGVVAGRLALGLDARVERRRPGVANDLNRGCRVRRGEQRRGDFLAGRNLEG